jgi:hypothetical protein
VTPILSLAQHFPVFSGNAVSRIRSLLEFLVASASRLRPLSGYWALFATPTTTRRTEVIAVHPGFSSDLTVPDDGRERCIRLVGGGELLFFGTAEPGKGLRTLLDALAEPALRDSPWCGWPARVGWWSTYVLMPEARGIEDRVTVTGRLDDADVAALYNRDHPFDRVHSERRVIAGQRDELTREASQPRSAPPANLRCGPAGNDVTAR